MVSAFIMGEPCASDPNNAHQNASHVSNCVLEDGTLAKEVIGAWHYVDHSLS
jgi:hypothetical protein